MDVPVSRTEEPSLAPETPPPPGEPEPSAPASTAPPAEPVPSPPPRPRPPRRKATQLAPPDEAPLASLPPEMSTAALEDRIRRLEDALAQMQHIQGRPPSPAAQIQSQPTTPAPAGPSASDLLLGVGKRLFNNAAPAPAATAVIPAPAAAPPSSPMSHLWLLWDTIAELRAIFRMFVDPRYHLPWSARVVPLVLLAAILTSYYWVPTAATVPFLGYWINKAADLILAFFLFKVLGHESRRYRQTSPDLPAHLRL